MKIADDVVDEIFLPSMWPKLIEEERKKRGTKAAADLPPFQAERAAAERRVERLVARALAAIWENVQKRLKVEARGEKHLPGKHDQRTHGHKRATISESEVDEFLRGSAIQGTLSHRTSSEAAASIKAGGVDVERVTPRSTFGAGFYTSRQPHPQYGEADLTVAIRSKRPHKGSVEETDKFITSLDVKPPEKRLPGGQTARYWDNPAEQQRAVRKATLSRGYDALVVTDGGNDIVVGLVADNIKIVEAGKELSSAAKALSDIPADQAFWDDQRTAFLAQAGTLPNELLLQGALEAEGLGIGVNFDLVNQGVLELAGTFTNEWWGRLETTTRDALRAATQAHIESGAPLPVLTKNLEPLFGKRRAEMIAATETTRLFADGNSLAYAQAGVTEVEWRTARDERVCPTCGPRYKERFPIGTEKPPAHVRCRCWVVPVVDGKPLDKVVED